MVHSIILIAPLPRKPGQRAPLLLDAFLPPLCGKTVIALCVIAFAGLGGALRGLAGVAEVSPRHVISGGGRLLAAGSSLQWLQMCSPGPG